MLSAKNLIMVVGFALAFTFSAFSAAIESLPRDLTIELLLLLPIKNIGDMALLSTKWHSLLNDDPTWQKLYKKHFDNIYINKTSCGWSYKASFKETLYKDKAVKTITANILNMPNWSEEETENALIEADLSLVSLVQYIESKIKRLIEIQKIGKQQQSRQLRSILTAYYLTFLWYSHYKSFCQKNSKTIDVWQDACNYAGAGVFYLSLDNSHVHFHTMLGDWSKYAAIWDVADAASKKLQGFSSLDDLVSPRNTLALLHILAHFLYGEGGIYGFFEIYNNACVYIENHEKKDLSVETVIHAMKQREKWHRIPAGNLFNESLERIINFTIEQKVEGKL